MLAATKTVASNRRVSYLSVAASYKSAIFRHSSLIAGSVGLYEPSRALKLASKKWPDWREGR